MFQNFLIMCEFWTPDFNFRLLLKKQTKIKIWSPKRIIFRSRKQILKQ